MQTRLLSITTLFATALILSACGRATHPSSTWEEERDSVRPQLMEKSERVRADLVHEAFTPEVDVGYVLHRQDNYIFVTNERLKDWGVSQKKLHQEALGNLQNASDELEVTIANVPGDESAKYITIETGDGYDAARILLPSLREKAAAELGEPYFAGIPTREFLIFWSADFPLHTDFSNQVRNEFKSANDYAVTPEVFELRGDRISVTKEE